MRCFEYPVLSLISDNYSGVSMSTFLSPQTFPSSDTSLSSGVSQSPDHLCVSPPVYNLTGSRDKISSSEAMSARTISRKSTLGSSAVYGSGLSSSHGSGLARSPSISRSNLGSLKYSTFSSGYSNPGSPGYTFSSYIARSGVVSYFMMFYYANPALSTSSAYSAISSATSSVVLRKVNSLDV